MVLLSPLTWPPDHLPALLAIDDILGDVHLDPEPVPAVLLDWLRLPAPRPRPLCLQPAQAPRAPGRQEGETQFTAHPLNHRMS